MPATALAGDRVFRVGTGAVMLKLRGLEVTVVGDWTLTEALPVFAIKLLGTVALSCAELPNVVASGAPFHKTVSPETKLAPETVSMNEEPPAITFAGDNPLKEGTGGLTVKLRELDVPPIVVCTLTTEVPMLAIKPAGTAAASCVELAKFVMRALPFHSTVSPDTKLLPLMVNVNAGPPAFLLAGESEVSVGTGGGAGAETIRVVVTTAGETTEPGELTVI